MSQAEILGHCRKVREGVDLPLVLYNAQFATQTPIDVATVRVLADEGTLAGLKDSSGDWSGFRELVVELGGRPGFSIVTGNEHMMDGTLLMGARGCIASTANVIPEVYAALYGRPGAGTGWRRRVCRTARRRSMPTSAAETRAETSYPASSAGPRLPSRCGA